MTDYRTINLGWDGGDHDTKIQQIGAVFLVTWMVIPVGSKELVNENTKCENYAKLSGAKLTNSRRYCTYDVL
jgi:hypothetical protein